MRLFLERARPYRDVLDIGAGRGYDLEIALEVEPAARLLALEAFAPSVAVLRERGVEVHAVDIEREPFPLPPESVDVIIATLREGGRLLIGVPNLASLHNRILLLIGRQPTSIRNRLAHVRGFTKGDLEALVEAGFPGGYRLREFRGANFYPFPPFAANPLARALPTMAWGIFLDFEKVRPYGREFLEYPVREQLETNFYLGS
jgi:SAM-dependent methyltransferase